MSHLISFFKSKQFLLHFALALLVLFLLLFGTLRWLNAYTSHNEFVVVPDFEGLSTSDLKKFTEGKDVYYMIIDSIYDPDEKKGIVLRQEPEKGSHVKHNRTVYLYVTGLVPPQLLMPKLIDRSERQARLIIETYGLKMGHITEIAADCNGCVIAQSSGNKSIEPGTRVKKGTVINLTVGRKDSYFNTSPEDSIKSEETGTEPHP